MSRTGGPGSGWSRGELVVMAGVRLVDRGVRDRGVVVLAHHLRRLRRGDDVRALRVRVEARRVEVRGERHEVADEAGRLDHDQVVVRGQGGQVVLDDEGAPGP